MDQFSMNSHLEISKDTIMDEDIECIYGAWGPYTNSSDNVLEYVQSHKVIGYTAICQDCHDGRFIIIQSTNTAHVAQGPFGFKTDQSILNEENEVIGVALGRDNRMVQIIGGHGMVCFESFGVGKFWVISKLHGFDGGQVFCAPPTIPSSSAIAVPQPGLDRTLDSQLVEVKGHVFQDRVEEDVDTTLLGSGTLSAGVTNEKIVEPEPSHLVDFAGDGANLGAPLGDEELAPLMPIPCFGNGHGDSIVEHEQDGVHLNVGGPQFFGPLPNGVDTNMDDVFAMFGDLLESDQAPKQGLHARMDFNNEGDATLMPIPHGASGTRMEVVANVNGGGGGLASMMQGHGDEIVGDNHVQVELGGLTHGHVGASHYELEGHPMVEERIASRPNHGDNSESTRKRPWMDKPPLFSLADVGGEMMEGTPMFEPIVGDGANGEMGTMPKKARVEKPPSPRSILRLNALRGETSSNEAYSLETTGTESNGNEVVASSIFGGLVETLEGDALHPAFDQGTSLCVESQWVNPQDNGEDISKDGEMEGQMVEGTVATTNTSSQGCKPSQKQPRQSKFKQHGVKRRQGGRESFVAYFRPKDLPESNKTFLTIGEYSNEREAWNDFNLFAFVHEGEDSCINMEDKDSIEMDAAFWGELPRVDLLAHLRLKGRGYFQSNVLPCDSFIPRYRNIKFRKNTRGVDIGKIRWFCDVILSKPGVTDPCLDNGQKHTFTYETAEEAAKEADRLSILNEGPMAWTNYTITDYMTKAETDQWDPRWIPLQDNPKKYLSTAKHNSFG